MFVEVAPCGAAFVFDALAFTLGPLASLGVAPCGAAFEVGALAFSLLPLASLMVAPCGAAFEESVGGVPCDVGAFVTESCVSPGELSWLP